MKRIFPFVAAFIVVFLLFSCVRRVPSKTSEKEEITKLIEAATTPEDHMKIADYYENQASEMKVKARSHASMAASYRARGKPLPGLFIHCRNLSKKYKEAAEEYKAMAMEHREIAKKMQKE
ncbi:MAG: hypothetical protein HYW01_05335 [Deltaproteobacteria bacterium]|nr:hypothetical protein [Deltaproteobacteria bacterium]